MFENVKILFCARKQKKRAMFEMYSVINDKLYKCKNGY